MGPALGASDPILGVDGAETEAFSLDNAEAVETAAAEIPTLALRLLAAISAAAKA